MNAKRYAMIREWFMEKPLRLNVLRWLYTWVPILTALVYGAMLLRTLLLKDARFFHVTAVPLITFLIGTFIRSAINAPRPYEKGIEPLIFKRTAGKSFPSRHMLSTGVIFATGIYLHRFVPLLLAISGIVGICRILSGVHSVSDVVCGFLFGLFLGLFAYALI